MSVSPLAASSGPLASQRVVAPSGNCHRIIAPWRQRQQRWAAALTAAAERRQQHQGRSRKPSRGVAAAAAAEADGADEEVISGAFCMPAFVTAGAWAGGWMGGWMGRPAGAVVVASKAAQGVAG